MGFNLSLNIFRKWPMNTEHQETWVDKDEGSFKYELRYVLKRIIVIFAILGATLSLLMFMVFPQAITIPISYTFQELIPNLPHTIKQFAKQTYGDITMPDYQTEKFEWGVANSTYHALGPKGSIEPYHHENWMKDAQGNFVAGWMLDGSAWGMGTDAIPGGSAAVNRLPKTVRLTYYDYADGHFYRLDAELPQQKIYELFKQKTLTHYSIETRPRYYDIKYGIGPKGFIVLWLSGIDQIEVATFQAQVMPDMTIEKYNQAQEEMSNKLLERSEWFNYRKLDKDIDEAMLAKLQSGWTPSADYYKTLRIKYPWRFEMTGNARMSEYEGYFANKEHRTVFQYEMTQNKIQLKAVPERAGMFFTDKAGQRYYLEFKFYDGYQNEGELDLSAIQKAFARLYPNRTAEDNEQVVPDSEFARIEIKVGDDVTQIQADLVKGEQRIPIQLYNVGYKKLPPHQFDERGPKPTQKEIRLLEFGPQSKVNTKVKIGDYCPETGYWSCAYLSSADGLFMRAGDRMPGQSAVARGDIPADTLWTLIKLGA